MSTGVATRTRRLAAVLRDEDRVTPLELFFDLVFVLALTQCTALMADEPPSAGIAKGMQAEPREAVVRFHEAIEPRRHTGG